MVGSFCISTSVDQLIDWFDGFLWLSMFRFLSKNLFSFQEWFFHKISRDSHANRKRKINWLAGDSLGWCDIREFDSLRIYLLLLYADWLIGRFCYVLSNGCSNCFCFQERCIRLLIWTVAAALLIQARKRSYRNPNLFTGTSSSLLPGIRKLCKVRSLSMEIGRHSICFSSIFVAGN